ncbi:MAG: ABC transporter substrate-binding protein [Bacteroidales bacterium]|jgi:iron complex transport system substrate-binding protein|nr:ABC transporter substrate-binding protein [Bacteroidales bacterium]
MKYLICLLFPFVVCISCKKETPVTNNENKIEITDYYNRKVLIKEDIKSIVSLSPGISELIFDLQSGDKLIGRTDYCNYPPQVRNITSIGGITNANVEKIISLQPDIVIASSMLSKSKLEQIERASIAIVSLPERTTVEGVYQTIAIIGKIVGKNALAEQKIKQMKQRIKVTKDKNEAYKTKIKVYYVIGFGSGGDFSAGANTYIDNILTLAGGDNIAKSSANWSFSREELLSQDPDFIFIRNEDYDNFIHTKPYTNLSAVINNKVFAVESSLMDCQSTRSVQIIEYISNIIHQDL